VLLELMFVPSRFLADASGILLRDDAVIEVSELCSFDAVKLVINGFASNPSVIPMTVDGGTFVVKDNSNG
jgi:hypothetical protein